MELIMIVQTTTKPQLSVPAFRGASAIVQSKVTEAKGNKALIQAFIDACYEAGVSKDQAGCEAIGSAMMAAFTEAARAALVGKGKGKMSIEKAAALKDAGVWEAAKHESIGLIKNTFTEYAKGTQMAFFHGVKWYASLKNKTKQPDEGGFGLPWGRQASYGKGKESAGKAGKVESTDRTALDATINKALKQARLLGQKGWAAEVEALCLEYLHEFKVDAAE